MREFQNQGREIFDRKEYWHDHSFEDDCAWDDADIKSYDHFKIELGRRNKYREKFAKASLDVISDFFQKGSSFALAEFREGTVFDGSSYHPGTIIREKTETLWPTEENLEYRTAEIFGVIGEVKINKKDQKFISLYGKTKKGRIVFLGISDPLIKVGTVDHARVRNWILPGENYESLCRTTSVEILQMGVGSTKKEEEKEKAKRFLKLSPQNI